MATLPAWGLPSHFLSGSLSRGWGRGQPGRAGPAKLVQPVPGPYHSHSCGLGTTSSSRPAGARPVQCGGCEDSPSPTLPGLQVSTRLAFPCQVCPYPRTWGQGLPLRIRRKFTPTHPRSLWGFWPWHQGLLLLINSLVTVLLPGPTDRCQRCHQETGLGAACESAVGRLGREPTSHSSGSCPCPWVWTGGWARRS